MIKAHCFSVEHLPLKKKRATRWALVMLDGKLRFVNTRTKLTACEVTERELKQAIVNNSTRLRIVESEDYKSKLAKILCAEAI